jgi:hypothetical protein
VSLNAVFIYIATKIAHMFTMLISNYGNVSQEVIASHEIAASSLTLIWAAGGVNDFRKFEQEQLNIALSNKKIFNSCIRQKTSREYFL